MRKDIIENTDKFNITSYGGGVAYCMSSKTRNRSFFVQGDDAAVFLKAYKDLMVLYGTEGSVYYRMTKNQVLASLFDVYDSISEDATITEADMAERIIN